MGNTIGVRTNTPSDRAHRAMRNAGVMQTRSSERLASGVRINSGADDPAGLGITEKMRSQVRSIDQASRNCHDAISMIETGDGTLDRINDMIIRIRELVVQAANDTNVHEHSANHSDRITLQSEINNMIEEIDNMALRAEFNTRTIMDGSYAGLELNPNFDPSAPIWLDGPTFNQEGFPFLLSVTDPIGQAEAAINNYVITQLEAWAAEKNISLPAPLFTQSHVEAGTFSAPLAATLNAIMSGLTFTVNPTGEEVPIVSPEPSNGLWIQNGPNVGGGMMMHMMGTSSRLLGIENINVLHESGDVIHQQIETLDKALAIVTGNRGTLGATQNRLEFTIESLDITSENLSEAISRIADADMAKEIMNSSKAEIMFQASQAMLAHANQAPQSVLQLLSQ